MTDEARTSWRTALLWASGGAVVLLAFRALQLRSSIHLVYHGESAGVGRLLWELRQGTFVWEGPRDLFHGLTYFEFAQGTVVLQLVAAALSPLLGLTLWALHGAGISMEAAGVFVLSVLTLRVARWRPAAVVAILALIFVPRTAQSFHLVPYGNHSEFLWIPALLGLWLHERWGAPARWSSVAVPIAVGAVGICCYRMTLPAVGATAVVFASLGGRDRVVQGAVILLGTLLASAALLMVGLGLPLHAFVPYFHTVAGEASSTPDMLLDQVRFAALRELPSVDLGAGTAWLHRGALALALGLCAVGFARRASGPVVVARFASLWALASIAVLAASNQVKAQYLIPSYYALLLCAIVLVVADGSAIRRWITTALLFALAIAGLIEGLPYVETATWAHNRPFRGLELQWRLGLNRVELDELPFYHRLLDEGRATRSVAAVSHHALDGTACRDSVGHRSGPVRPEPAGDHCTGWVPGQLCAALDAVVADPTVPSGSDSAADVGRGAWIRANRSVAQVERGLEGCAEPARAAALQGAVDEARRWGIDPEL